MRYGRTRRLRSVGTYPSLDTVESFAEAFRYGDNVTAVLEHITHLVTKFTEFLFLLPITIEKVRFVRAIRSRIFQMLDHYINQLAKDVGILYASLLILVQSKNLFHFIPEKERQGDSIAVLVSGAAFQNGLNKTPELSRESSNHDDPCFPSFCKDPGNSFVGIKISKPS